MYSLKKVILLIGLVLLMVGVLNGCTPETVVVTAVPIPTTTTSINSQTVTPKPSPTSLPSPSTTLPQPTATNLPPATATPLPQITWAVPSQFSDTAETVLGLLQNSTNWQWKLSADELAAVSLMNSPEGTIVYQEPLVLAVPFTTDWETTSSERAADIMANGHQIVTIMPWSQMPPTQKALRIDGRFPADSDYPFHDSWSLVAQPMYETAVAELAPLLQAELEQPLIHLAAVGDLMLARSLGNALAQGDLAYPFAFMAESLKSADITLGNVESALGDLGQPAAKRYPFQAPPQAASALAEAGFDIVSLANNHAMDYGPDALLQAIELLHGQGVLTSGAGADVTDAHTPIILDLEGVRIATLSYVNVPVEALTNFDTASWTATANAPGLAWAEPEKIKADVTAVAAKADLVLVMLHSGYEYVAAPSPPQKAAAHAAIDAGADLVIGHHAHILQGIEFYNDGVILYGIGNYAFEIDGAPETAIFHVWLDADGVRQIDIEPAIIKFGGQPRPAVQEEAYAIRQQLYGLTNILNPQ